MTSKVVFCFIIAACLALGSQAHSTKPEPRSIADIIDNIKEIVSQVKQALDSLIHQVPEIIKNIEDKIKEIISSINVDEIISSIKAKIDEILNNLGLDLSKVQQCIDNEKQELKDLADSTIQGIIDCQKNAEGKIQEIRNAVEEAKAQFGVLVEDSASAVKQCIDENGANLPNLVQCLKNHLETIKQQGHELILDIVNIVQTATDTAIQVDTCIAKVRVETKYKEVEIIKNIVQCVENNQ